MAVVKKQLPSTSPTAPSVPSVGTYDELTNDAEQGYYVEKIIAHASSIGPCFEQVLSALYGQVASISIWPSGTPPTKDFVFTFKDHIGVTWTWAVVKEGVANLDLSDKAIILNGTPKISCDDMGASTEAYFVLSLAEPLAGTGQKLSTVNVIQGHQIHVINSPELLPVGASMFKVPKGVTFNMSRVHARVDAGTITFNLERRAENAEDSSGTDILTADLVADATGEETAVFDGSGLVVGPQLVCVAITSSTGSPTELWIDAEFTKPVQ